MLDRNGKSELITLYRDGLLKDTMPFWIEHCVDREHGGFMMSVDRDGSIIDTDKSVWQQGRFTWLLGEMYNQVEPRDEWLALAKHGVEFLDRHCYDSSDGRMWFHVTREGQPIRKRRYAFSESFAAIAYGELAKATGEQEYADKAQRTFQRFLDHNLDPQGVEPKYTSTRPMRGLGFPMITIVTAQELRESIDLSDANEWIDRGIEDIRQFHLKEDLQCVVETVGLEGQIIDHFDGRTLNPGHAIEGAWFIMWEGHLRGDQELIKLGCQMLDWMWERGWDKEYGGMLYYVDLYGKPVQEYWHDMKFMWPQNENRDRDAARLSANRRFQICQVAPNDPPVVLRTFPRPGAWRVVRLLTPRRPNQHTAQRKYVERAFSPTAYATDLLEATGRTLEVSASNICD